MDNEIDKQRHTQGYRLALLKQMASFFVNFPLNLCRIVDIICVRIGK